MRIPHEDRLNNNDHYPLFGMEGELSWRDQCYENIHEDSIR